MEKDSIMSSMNRRHFLQAAGATAGMAAAAGVFAATAVQDVPSGDRVERDVVYGKGGEVDLRVDVYHPAPGADRKRMAVIHLHAGGFTAGNKSGVATSSQAYAALGFVSLAAQYRLANQGTWPAPIHDAKAAVRWARANASRLDIDPARIAIAGYSAGGLIALFVAGTAGQSEFEGTGGNTDVDSRIAACAAYYPVASGGSARCQCIVPPGSDRVAIEAASPVSRISPAFAPTIFFHGLGDTIIQPESTLNLFEKLQVVGVRVDLHFLQGAPHGYDIDDADAALVSARLTEHFLDRLILRPREYGGGARGNGLGTSTPGRGGSAGRGQQ